MNNDTFKIGILASGNLGFECIKFCLQKKWKIAFIATDNHSKSIINFAIDNNIACFKGNPRKSQLSNFLSDELFDIILSINYLFLIEEDIINKAKNVVNFHGSLLPKYRGRTPHVWAIINNEIETGITAHLIDKGCDTGEILIQKNITINNEDTGAEILKKYESVYPEIIENILLNIDNLVPQKQDNSKAIYFGKRTPDDGLINWNWQKERIFNWVRAQAYPYPGAFSFIDNQKIVIDKITFSDQGFSDSMANGLVIEDTPYIKIKTPNGVVILDLIRENKYLVLKNKILQ